MSITGISKWLDHGVDDFVMVHFERLFLRSEKLMYINTDSIPIFLITMSNPMLLSMSRGLKCHFFCYKRLFNFTWIHSYLKHWKMDNENGTFMHGHIVM